MDRQMTHSVFRTVTHSILLSPRLQTLMRRHAFMVLPAFFVLRIYNSPSPLVERHRSHQSYRPQHLYPLADHIYFALYHPSALSPISCNMSGSLAGRVVIVTGASRGIGAAIARQLGADGATVVINYVNSSKAAEDLATEITAKGPGKAISIKADLTSISEAKRLVDETIQALGKVDVLALNAAIMDNAPLAQVTEELYDKHFVTNVKVPLFMAQHAAPLMKEGKCFAVASSRVLTVFSLGGRIIFFSTSLTINTAVPPNYVLYVATKGAVEQITRVLAKDLGARGLTVNAIAPGPTDTDMFRTGKSEQLIQFFANGHPLKRLAVPEDIAPAVSFLASEGSRWINGQTWYVNGVSDTLHSSAGNSRLNARAGIQCLGLGERRVLLTECKIMGGQCTGASQCDVCLSRLMETSECSSSYQNVEFVL